MFTFFPADRFFLSVLLTLTCLNGFADNDGNLSTTDQQTTFSLHIDQNTQATTRIEILELSVTELSPEITSFAIQVDLAPLLKLRAEYFLALAQQQTANIKLEQAQKAVQRLRNLQREKAVSIRKLQEQQTQLQIEQLAYNSAKQQCEDILLNTKSQWGAVLSHWFLDKSQSAKIHSMLTRPLYRVYLPIGSRKPSKKIYIQAFGYRELAQSASLVSYAPFIENPQHQIGQPFYYQSDQILSQPQQRVTVWLPETDDKLSGIIIPASSLVWHLGQSYVYLQRDEELFERIKVSDKKLIDSKSYFIQNALKQGDMIVSTGAQMLLSEEFRGQIPDEDDDD